MPSRAIYAPETGATAYAMLIGRAGDGPLDPAIRLGGWVAAALLIVLGFTLIWNLRLRRRIAATLAELSQHRAERLRLESDLDRFFNLAIDMHCIVDAHGAFLRVSPAAETLLGYPPEHFIGRTVFEFIHPDDRARSLAELGRINRGGPQMAFENRYLRADGATVWLSWRSSRVIDGRIYATARDVTERKTSEQRQAFMVRELDHRVKNNLAAILSLADQTTRSVSSLAEFRDAFAGRISALTKTHSLLAQANWRGMEFHDLIRETLGPFLDGAGRVVTEGPRCLLPARAASPLCMAMHELATNAAKYGALVTPAGSVAIKWSVRGHPDAPDGLTIVWNESGGPPVESPARYGLGTSLIDGAIRYQLSGAATFDFDPAGLAVTLDIDFSLTEEPLQFDADAIGPAQGVSSTQ